MSKWEMVKLGEIATIVTGTTPKSNVEKYWNGIFNWVTPAELSDDSDIIYDTERKITESAIKNSSLKSFPKGTVLLSSRAPIGKVAIAGTEMYCNQGFKNFICLDKIFNKYLYWFLKGKTQYLNSLGRGATFKEISKSIVEQISIPLPPLEVQEKIAHTLDTVSDLMKMYKEQLEQLDVLVKSRFVEMFGDPLSNPMGWETKKLKDICENIDNMRVPIASSEREKGEYPYYGASGVVDYVKDYIFDETLLLVSEDGANLLARVTPIAFEISGKTWVNNHAHVLRFKEYSLQKYVEYVINMQDISNYITGSAQPKLNQAKLNQFIISMP